MKKTTGLMLVLTLLSMVFTSFKAGEKITEGVVEFDIAFLDLTPEMKQAEAMLPKKLTMYFKGENIRGEMPTAMGNTITIANEKKKEFYVLMDMMGQKTAIKQTEADIKKQQLEQDVKDIKVTQTSETKTIAGYTCKKAIVTFKLKGDEEKVECFYTEDLPVIGNKNSSPGFDQIKGFMMEYSLNMNGIKMRMTATSVRAEKIDDSQFVVPKDYTVKTVDEIKKMSGDH